MNNSVNIPAETLQVIRMLNDFGYEAYAVGGCVRDSIMGKTPHDWDIATSARPEEVKRVFSDRRTADTGIKYGTVSVIGEDGIYEVTTFRSEKGYSDYRHPSEIRFSGSLKEDLSRRDFKMNSMAYHPDKGIIDPFGGMGDIKEKKISCVGNPHNRLREDPLRILRGLRFSMTLGFDIEHETAAEMHFSSQLLSRISAERIKTELEKMLTAEFFSAKKFEKYKKIICSAVSLFNGEKLCPELVERYDGGDINICWALLLCKCGENAADICSALKFSNILKRNVCGLISFFKTSLSADEVSVRRVIRKIGAEQALRLAQMKNICENETGDFPAAVNKIITENQCCTIGQLAVDGRMLIENGFSRGREIGEMLDNLLNMVIEGKLPNDRDELLRLAISKKNAQRNYK